MSGLANEGFRDSSALTKWTKLLLYAGAAVAAISQVSNVLEASFLADVEAGVFMSEGLLVAAAESNDVRQGVVGLLYLGVFVPAVISVAMWIHRANYNARELGALQMEFTPGWAVGWYFVPVANLWKPYQAMKEIWRASHNPADWRREAVPSLLGWWWFLWITSAFAASTAFRMSIWAQELAELSAANSLYLVSDSLDVALNLVTAMLVSRIAAAQLANVGSSNAAGLDRAPVQGPTEYRRDQMEEAVAYWLSQGQRVRGPSGVRNATELYLASPKPAPVSGHYRTKAREVVAQAIAADPGLGS